MTRLEKVVAKIQNKTINGLTILFPTDKIIKSKRCWVIKCHCGLVKEMFINDLLKGKTKSCGCQKRLTNSLDLTSKRFGTMVCVKKIGRQNRCCIWLCKCDCGKEFTGQSNYIQANRISNCGCQKGRAVSKFLTKDITGQRFGRLTALKIVGQNKSSQKIWECRCDCGKITTSDGSALRRGSSKSCGCFNIERLKARVGLKHPYYDPLITEEQRLKKRSKPEFISWSKTIKRRDKFCQCCNSKYKLHAHHIMPYSKYPDLGLDLSNGIALCQKCHLSFHAKHRFDVNKQQLDIFIKEYKEKNDKIE